MLSMIRTIEVLGETIAVLEDSIHVRMEYVQSCTIHCLKANIIINASGLRRSNLVQLVLDFSLKY